MTAALLAHSDSASSIWGLAFVGVMVAAATIWVIRINLRLDSKEEGVEDKRPSTFGLLAIGAVIVALGLMFFAVYRAQSGRNTAQAQDVMSDLCTAITQAKTDPAAAQKTYNNRPHNALHTLVTDVQAKDPQAAGRLSRAEQQAEQAMASSSSDTVDFLKSLAEQTATAYRIADPGAQITNCP